MTQGRDKEWEKKRKMQKEVSVFLLLFMTVNYEKVNGFYCPKIYLCLPGS